MYQFNHLISHIIDMFSQHLADMALMQLYFIFKNAKDNDHNIAIVKLRDNN